MWITLILFLEDLYGHSYDESKLIDIINMNSHIFYMIGDDDPSLFVAGYIILKDGRLVKIDQSQNHENVISYFLTLYLELTNMCHFGNTYDAIKKMNEYGFPIYVGAKAKYVGNREAGNAAVENSTGMFSIFLPSKDVGLTSEQISSIEKINEAGEAFNTDGFNLNLFSVSENKEYSIEEFRKMYFTLKKKK